MATLRPEDLVCGPIDGPHTPSPQLFLEGKPLVEGRSDHRMTPWEENRIGTRTRSSRLSINIACTNGFGESVLAGLRTTERRTRVDASFLET